MELEHLTKQKFIGSVDDFEKDPDKWNYLGDKPCIIDFYATWCGPCKALSPILEEIAEEYKDKLYVYKVDVDKEEELSAAFGIRSVPSVLWIPMSGNPSMSQGALPKSEVKRIIDEKLLVKE